MGILTSFQKTVQSPKQTSQLKVCLGQQNLRIYVKKIKSNYQYMKCFGKFNSQNLLPTRFGADRNSYKETKLMMIGSFSQKDFTQEFSDYFEDLTELYQLFKSSKSSRITINYDNSEIILTKKLYNNKKDKSKYELKSFYIQMNLIFTQFPKSSNETIEFLTKIIQQKSLFVYGTSYLSERWDIFFSCVRSISLQKLSFNQMHFTDVFQIISPINFRNLKMLWLNNNSIKNIQGLQFLGMNFLERLWLDQNRINSLKCFKKLNFEKLIVLSVNSNIINSFEQIVRCNIFNFLRQTKSSFQNQENNQKISLSNNSNLNQINNNELSKLPILMLERFFLIYVSYQWDFIISYDISFLFKIGSSDLNQLWCQRQKRINSQFQRQQKMLLKKYNNIKIFSHTQHISAKIFKT